jgi:hypothetical protein
MTNSMRRLRLLTRLGLTTSLLRFERWAARSDLAHDEHHARPVARKQLAARR